MTVLKQVLSCGPKGANGTQYNVFKELKVAKNEMDGAKGSHKCQYTVIKNILFNMLI